MPTRPGAEDDADPDVLDAEDVLDVDEVGGDRGRHEEERDEDDDHHQPDEPVLEEEREAVPRATPFSVRPPLGPAADGERQAGGADDDERHRVDDSSPRGAADGDEDTPADRPDREPERAGRLDDAVRAPAASARPPTSGHEGELGRLCDRDPGAEERRRA